jgi:hypothetical protein
MKQPLVTGKKAVFVLQPVPKRAGTALWSAVTMIPAMNVMNIIQVNAIAGALDVAGPRSQF